MSFFPDPFKVLNGLRSGVKDAGGLVHDVVTGNVHGAVTNTRSLFGDVGDVLQGLEGLGVNLGPVPSLYAKSPFGMLSDSEVLAAAQLMIEGERALTGSGEPEDGKGYKESAKNLNGAVETLINANPHADRWDGKASEAYEKTNDVHRRNTSNVQAADEQVAAILGTEGGQVSRTRETLDDASQKLYDYGLSTAWMNAFPPLRVAKFALDSAAAATALATTNTTMMILTKNVAENALRMRSQLNAYEKAREDTSGSPGDSAEPGSVFVPQKDDISDGGRPSRTDPNRPYEVPIPEGPPVNYPPATPYGSPATPAPRP
ncbi:hypothetical protein MFM001_05340 [Mycobacterium sp. MFM001]|uniref:EspA/EspE family type VII secretion system effector n=1 Tax=Mycobacterium sp. MFM001 TaxID=2049453 RepID=UPI000DA5ADD7|nr:EspA/EspE family type VII secretion system effector [Mycobacterium sp. MFM001]GBE64072.1 hypothetical protein MFM001_05340 [Mycobacterium sp. MFM001]